MTYIVYNNLYFTTCTTENWKNLPSSYESKKIIVDTLTFLTKEKKVVIYAFVIMDNHLHLLWESIDSFKILKVIHNFKSFTSKKLKDLIPKPELEKYLSRCTDRKIQIWKRGSLTVDITSPKFLDQKLNYIHKNPWKHVVVENNVDYKYCSARPYAERVSEFEFLTLCGSRGS